MATESMKIIVSMKNAARAGFKSLNTDLKTVDKQTKKASKGMKGFYGELVAIGTFLAGGAFLGGAVKTFATFDDNMRAAGAVTNATADELERMTAIAKKMGEETRYTASESAEALRFLGMAGFEASEAIGALPGVLNLAAAGALDLGTAADIATNVLTAFGLEVGDLAQVNDVLVKTFTSANVNLVEIGEAFKMVGPIAKGVGADFEDLIGTIGALGNAGIKGTMGGTALKNALDALLSPTAKEAELMKQLEARMGGVALKIKDTAGDFIGFKTIIEQLEQAGLRGDEALRMFGLRAGPGMTALMNQGSAALGGMIDGLRKAGGTADEIAIKMEAGLGGELRRTTAVLEGLKISIGDAFGPEIQEFLRVFQVSVKDMSAEITKMAERGDFEQWGETAIEIFGVLNKAISVTIHGLSAMSSLTMALGGIVTGNLDFAKAAMEGWVEDVNKIWEQAEDPLAKKVGKYIGVITQEMRDELKKSEKPSSPIGKGAKKVGDNLAKNIVPVASIEARLKAAIIRLNAELKAEEAVLDTSYQQKLIDVNKYYDERIQIAKEKIAAERNLLVSQLGDARDISKRTILNAKIYALDKALTSEITLLNGERVSDQEALDASLLKKKNELNRKQVQADKVYEDQKMRIRQEGATTLDVSQMKELADLQERQNKELEVVKAYHQAVIDDLVATNASKLLLDQAYVDQKQAVDEQQALQQKEADQVAVAQQLQLSEYRLNNLASLAQGVSQIFTELYQMTGEKNKELFYAAKAAALAEATINVATGVTNALKQQGFFGIAQGVAVAAAGAIQIATIASQGLAEGGAVLGSSPSKTADNIPIMATAGEFMQPVDAVEHYGKAAMEGIRNKTIPRGALAGYSTGGAIGRSRNDKYAQGGLITSSDSNTKGSGKGATEITMINVTDPREIDQYLNTPAGQNAVLNVISSRAETVRRIVR